MELVGEEENLAGFKNRREELSHLAKIEMQDIKNAYDAALPKMGLEPLFNFSHENKDQLILIKFLSLEERLQGALSKMEEMQR